MSNILTKNKMNGIKKIDSNCENVLPHTKMAGRDKNDRTNSRTFCQQNRIAFSQDSPDLGEFAEILDDVSVEMIPLRYH
jgi:hypothetical protein